MPLYTISTRKPLDSDTQAKIAMMITDVHCGHTNALRTFVQVYFSRNVPLNKGTNLHIYASVRAGRTMHVNDGVEHDMIDQMSELTGIPLGEMEYAIFGIPAKWIMEGGVVLPDPGDEAQWLKDNNHAA